MNDQTATPSESRHETGKALTIAQELGVKQKQFLAALPAHIPAERFARVVLTAIQNNQALARADRPSLWNACMKAAQDGLLPDGREGALVIYNTKKDGEWLSMVSWMPMIAGIRKKVRNSSTIATWDVHVVHARDQFEFELGDDPFIKHKPFLDGDPGEMIAVYSVAVLKTGEKSRDVMTRAQVEYVRDNYSKRDRDGKFSPAWVKSFDEMAKKTVARRHAKVLPMSTDLDDLLRRDDDLYDLNARSDKAVNSGSAPKTLNDRLAMLVDAPIAEIPSHDPETGEIAAAADAEKVSSPADADADSKPTTSPDALPPVGTAPETGARPNARAKTPTARDARPGPNAGQETAKPASPDAALLADLMATGKERAEQGRTVLEHWLDEDLNSREQALMTPSRVRELMDHAASQATKDARR